MSAVNTVHYSKGFRPSACCTILLLVGLLAGCATIRGFPDAPRTADTESPAPDWELGPKAIKAYNSESDPAKKKSLRDEILDSRIAALDVAFSEYGREIYREDVSGGLATDWAVLALTATTTVAGAASTKTALGAASTAILGATSSFDKRALFDKTLPALLAQMVAARETIRAQILLSKNLSVADYSWGAAESDLQRFAFAGSLIGAIASVTEDAAKKADSAKQQVQDVTNGKFQDSDNSKLLQSFWKPGGSVDSTNEAKLTTWMTNNGISTAPGMITMFVLTSTFEASRAKAVKDLGLK